MKEETREHGNVLQGCKSTAKTMFERSLGNSVRNETHKLLLSLVNANVLLIIKTSFTQERKVTALDEPLLRGFWKINISGRVQCHRAEILGCHFFHGAGNQIL